MEVTAILKGSAAGVIVGLILAVLFGLIRFYAQWGGVFSTVLFWIGAILVFLLAGMVAGRASDELHWMHGALAALTLNLVGNVLAEMTGHGDFHFWLDLSMASMVGLIGGVWGANLLP